MFKAMSLPNTNCPGVAWLVVCQVGLSPSMLEGMLRSHKRRRSDGRHYCNRKGPDCALWPVQFVNTTGASPVSTGLVQRLMSTASGAAMFGGEGCDPTGSAVQVQVLVLCTLVLDPGWINTPSQQSQYVASVAV